MKFSMVTLHLPQARLVAVGQIPNAQSSLEVCWSCLFLAAANIQQGFICQQISELQQYRIRISERSEKSSKANKQ